MNYLENIYIANSEMIFIEKYFQSDTEDNCIST